MSHGNSDRARHHQRSQGSDDINALLTKIDALLTTSGEQPILSSSSHAQHVEAQTEELKEELKDEGFVEAQLREIQKGKEHKLPTDIYAKSCYNWMQMHEIRKGLESHLDIHAYSDPLFSASQMREIRLGMLCNLDTSSYAKLLFSAGDMRNIRKALFAELYAKNPKSFGKTYKDSDTGMHIRISDDCMSAYAMLTSSYREDLTESDVMQAFEDYEIVNGVLNEAVAKLVTEKPLEQEICVARGKYPTSGKPGHFEIFFENSIEKGHVVPPDGEIDYTDVNFVDMAYEGDVLAKYHPAQKSLEGMTVFGIAVEGSPQEDLAPLTGSGFIRSEDNLTYTAAISGFPSYDDATGSLNVWNIYEVHGDVSYFQSVEYDGTIHVCGSVQNMATIRATGDIIIDGFVENAHIDSKQNVVIKGGVNGGSVGTVTAGGTIRGKFFENAALKAGGMIEGNYFLNCEIETDDRLSAKGKKARIMGGKVSAAVGVEAVIVGNYLSSRTVFRIGDTVQIQDRIYSIMQSREKAIEELNMLNEGKAKLALLLGEPQVQSNALYQKTCAAIATKEAEIEECDRNTTRLRGVIKRSVNAYIRVYGQIQSDITLVIGGVRKVIERDINRNIFLTREILLKEKETR